MEAPSENETQDAGAMSDCNDLLGDTTEQDTRCVVRVRTSMWTNKSGVHAKKSLTFLRRQCAGFNVLEEDCSMVGPELVFPRILNLDECQDGIYEVVTCNEVRDYESGHIEDYDYRLVSPNA